MNEIEAVTYAESREAFFAGALRKAERQLDWAVKHNPDCYVCAEKGEAVAFYQDALAALRAEEEGRCVVLPVRVGDSVWDRFGYHWTITRIELHMAGRIWFRCGNKGTDDYTAFSDDEIGESIFLKESDGNAAKERWEKERAAIISEAALTRKLDGGGQDGR